MITLTPDEWQGALMLEQITLSRIEKNAIYNLMNTAEETILYFDDYEGCPRSKIRLLHYVAIEFVRIMDNLENRYIKELSQCQSDT